MILVYPSCNSLCHLRTVRHKEHLVFRWVLSDIIQDMHDDLFVLGKLSLEVKPLDSSVKLSVALLVEVLIE